MNNLTEARSAASEFPEPLKTVANEFLDRLDRVFAENAILSADRAKLLELVRAAEWAGEAHGCPWCWAGRDLDAPGDKLGGHSETCAAAPFLEPVK